MTTETHSDSRFYHGDCLCDKEILTSLIAIQCKNCINYSTEDCDCKDTTIKYEVCNKCSQLRDKIDILNSELDNIAYNMINEIKKFMNCEDTLERINEISIELRNLNRMLLENIVRKK